MKVIVSGGGTAGHIYPALTVAAELAGARDDVTFVGTPDGL
ncbi:MAG: UDP-N-acetylglucosamine--N-acetylmuramyl-(pentapeptide) pyrophosphoryl-undecaprenol N-acetylglucosamine transferase, partial [Actinobacteria bacterium]